MVAYSTITHIGYILLGMSISPDKSVNIIMGYLTVYVITSFGFFALSGQIFTQQGKNIDNIDDFAGLGTQKPYHALMMTVMMLSLAGIPPMAGFFVKFTILWHIISHTSGLASVIIPVLAVTASAISAFYYLRIIKVMYFDKPNSNFTTASGILIVPVICSVPLVLYILNPSVVQNIMDYFIRIYGFE
jgi:NADH-quinone oxidoreductase subunit N